MHQIFKTTQKHNLKNNKTMAQEELNWLNGFKSVQAIRNFIKKANYNELQIIAKFFGAGTIEYARCTVRMANLYVAGKA